MKQKFCITENNVFQENYDQVIFECLNPIGEILPGRTMSVEWRFSPLEAKTYMVDIPIYVHHGDMAVVTFTGVGYDRRIMGHTMPVTEHQDLSGVPSVQSATMPGQVNLSAGCLSSLYGLVVFIEPLLFLLLLLIVLFTMLQHNIIALNTNSRLLFQG